MASFDYEVECPECGARFRVPRIRLGRREPCPVCRAGVEVKAVRAAEHGHGPGPGSTDEAAGTQEVEAPQEPVPAAEGREAFEPEAAPLDEGARYAVCCAREEKPNPLAIAPLVARFTGLGEREARRHVVRSMGLLLEGLDRQTAGLVVDALREEGVEALAVPEAWVPRLVPELPLVRVYGADESALYVQTDQEGAVRALPWTDLALGICTTQTYRDLPQTELAWEDRGGPLWMGLHGPARTDELVYRPVPAREPPVEVELVLAAAEAAAQPLRFSEGQVRYAYLAERLRPGHGQNLPLLLDDVMRWAGHAFFPEGFRMAAAGRRLRVTRLVARTDKDRYLRWAMCCAAARGLFRRR